MNSSVEKFREIINTMLETYIKKNADYGDSFSKSIEKYGNIAGLTRISDKFNRLESLILGGKHLVLDESLKDTLLDLSSYCIMLAIELDKKEGE